MCAMLQNEYEHFTQQHSWGGQEAPLQCNERLLTEIVKLYKQLRTTTSGAQRIFTLTFAYFVGLEMQSFCRAAARCSRSTRSSSSNGEGGLGGQRPVQ